MLISHALLTVRNTLIRILHPVQTKKEPPNLYRGTKATSTEKHYASHASTVTASPT